MKRWPWFQFAWKSTKRLSRRRCMQGMLAVIGSLLVVGWQSQFSPPIQAQGVTQATVTEIVDGNQVFIQDRQAQVNSVARRQQQVRTRSARAELQFNTGAIARLSQNSSLTVGQCANLERGTLLVNGPLNGCTRSTVSGVRGTIYTLEVNDEGLETLTVFEGQVAVTRRSDADFDAPIPSDSTLPEAPPPDSPAPDSTEINSPPAGWQAQTDGGGPEEVSPEDRVDLTQEPVVVAEGQSLSYDPEQQQAAIRQLTPEDFERLLRGPLISDFTQEIPGIGDLQSAFERLFPSLPFPIPSLPGLPIRLPFPF